MGTGHCLIVRGIGRVRKGRVPTHYHAEAALDMPVQRDGEGKRDMGRSRGMAIVWRIT